MHPDSRRAAWDAEDARCCPLHGHSALPITPVHPVFAYLGGLMAWAIVERLLATQSSVLLPEHLARFVKRRGLRDQGILKGFESLMVRSAFAYQPCGAHSFPCR